MFTEQDLFALIASFSITVLVFAIANRKLITRTIRNRKAGK